MLRRFAAASIVASIAVAIATVVVLGILRVSPQRISLALGAWAIAPCAWGLWAMLSPAKWVPQRLPIWGMTLGIIAGVGALLVLNIPLFVLGVSLPPMARAVGVLVAAAFYYGLWMAVRSVYSSLGVGAG